MSYPQVKKRTIEEFYQVNPKYIDELYFLQVELLKLQKHISNQKLKLAIFFEGRDAAGKGSAIARFSQFLNPQGFRSVALGKPTIAEKGQWYFQRYIKQLPNPGMITFFDRSWYNRAVVEPAMGFCTDHQYGLFMEQVNLVEKLLIDDQLILIKFWFSIDAIEQKLRIQERIETPLIQWKVSPVDLAAQEKWDDFSKYKRQMFEGTHTEHAPWMIVKGSSREESRIQAMKYLLSLFEYENKSNLLQTSDPQLVFSWK